MLNFRFFSLIVSLAALALSCGAKESEDLRPRRRKNSDVSKPIPLVSSNQRRSYLESAAQDISGMVLGTASIAEVTQKMEGLCESFQSSYATKSASGEVMMPECKSDGDVSLDIASFGLFRYISPNPDDISFVRDALEHRGTEMMTFLLQYRYYNVNGTDQSGKTLAMVTAGLGNLDGFLYLVSQNVDLLLKDKDGCNAHCWAKKGSPSADAAFMKRVEEEMTLAEKNVPELTRLFLAQAENTRANRNYEIITRLIASGANINARNGDGVAAVVGFVKTFDLRALTLMVEHKNSNGELVLDLSLRVRRKNLRQYAEWALSARPGDCTEQEARQVVALLTDMETAGRLAPASP